jgi:hypothetical protein
MNRIRLTESDLSRIIRRVIMEDDLLDLLDGEKSNYPKRFGGSGDIQGRSIETMEDAIKYTRGTRVSAKDIMRAIDNGNEIMVYTNKSNVTGSGGRHKKVFLNYTTGEAYNEKDQHMGNFKGVGGLGGSNEMLDSFEEYLES